MLQNILVTFTNYWSI